jgi:hypothetical protein
VAAVNFLNTLRGWAASALSALFGGITNPVSALQTLWHYVSSLHNVVSWLFSNPVVGLALSQLRALGGLYSLAAEIVGGLRRLPRWIWLQLILPVQRLLQHRIDALRAWTVQQLAQLRALVWLLYRRSLAYTRALVAAEHKAMLRAVAAEHAAMLAGDKATLATVQKQASSGDNAGRKQRLGVVQTLLDDLAEREPALKDLTGLLVKAVLDLEEVDNPILRFIAGRALGELIQHLGLDHVTGDLIGRLLGPLTSSGRPANLYDAMRDLETRTTSLEDQWAAFFKHGGEDVEAAGDEWQALRSVLTDAALLSFAGLGIADPQAWATGVNDVIAVPVNDALRAAYDLIRHA